MKEKFMLLILATVFVIGFVLMSGCIGNDGGQGEDNTNNTTNTTTNGTNESCDEETGNGGVCRIPTEENKETH